MRNRLYKILKSKVFLHPRRAIWKLLRGYLESKQLAIVRIGEPSGLIEKIKTEVRMLLRHDEARNIYWVVRSTENVPGDIAEAGVYQGGSAKLICEAKNGRHLYLFDTFDGLPVPSQGDKPELYKGQFACSLEKVRRYLAKYENVHFYKGTVPLSCKPVEKNRFSFVHLDLDLYEGTLACLRFFYPRLSTGGVLMGHDYPSFVGVQGAWDEFFRDKPEQVLRISSGQCLIVKTG